MSRKLASVQRIWKIEPIEGADRIELAYVLGWQCVVNKNQFAPTDLAVYFEIDSFLPVCSEFEFLRASSYRKTDIMGETVGTGAKSGIYFEDTSVQPKAFALMFQFEGDENATKYVLYNCKMSRPDIESSTTEDGIEVQTVSGELTASPRAFDNIVKGVCASTGVTAYTNWFTAVQG